MVKFNSFDEYDAWEGERGDEPVLIDDGWRMSMDMTVDARSAVGAVEAFSKEFMMPETRMLLRDMEAEVEDGTYFDSTQRLNPSDTNRLWEDIGAYSWAVERMDDTEWYVFLNASGNFLGRVK